MTLQEIEEWLWKEANREALSWFTIMCENNYAEMYLYYKPSGEGIMGELKISENQPAGFKLAPIGRLHCGLTKDQVKIIIQDISRKLPILAY